MGIAVADRVKWRALKGATAAGLQRCVYVMPARIRNVLAAPSAAAAAAGCAIVETCRYLAAAKGKSQSPKLPPGTP